MRRALLILLACVVVGCSLRKPPTGEDFYAQGQLNFAEGEYNAAIENYQLLIDHYPFSPYAEDAELKIGLAFYRMKSYVEAIGALDDFQRMHPTSKNLPLASYYIAMSYFDRIGREDQDQTNTEQALKHFQIIEQRFPEGAFAQLAHQHAETAREMLARHQMVVGDYYFDRANFRAAESRFAELMQKYPKTPVAPDALYRLGLALDKQGKKYSAAQAFAAVAKHFPNTTYSKKSLAKLKKLKQPTDSEVDPLSLVLAESGYGESFNDGDGHVTVHQRDGLGGGYDTASSAPGPAYGPDGLPILSPRRPQDGAKSPHPKRDPGPATLKNVRLAAVDRPMSAILDLTGPVKYARKVDSSLGSSTVTLILKDVTPDASLRRHLDFERSIFRDCDILAQQGATVVTLNTAPILDFAVVPLDDPPRLLVTFTPKDASLEQRAGSGL